MKRTFFLGMVCGTISLSLLPAVDSVSVDQIQLPVVTTVITGDTVTAGDDAVPDYDSVLPDTDSAAVPLPQLPDIQDSVPDSSAPQTQASQKDIFAEGEVGGGYPGYFTGDFSVYKSGKNPFRIDFSHESVNGYGSKTASDGFFDQSTVVSAQKTFTGLYSNANFSASYDTENNGLQSQSLSFFDMTRHTFSTSAFASWMLPHHFSLSAGTDGNWYNRYGGIPDSAADASAAQKGATIVDFSPYVKTSWGMNGFDLGLEALYSMQGNFGNDDALTASEGSMSAQSSHRGEGTFSAEWKNTTVHVTGTVSLVCGTALGDPIVIVPWSAGLELFLTTPLSPRLFDISAEGGLDSYQSKYRELESEYRYSYLSSIPSETTDWYGKIHACLPVKDFITVSGEASCRKTAFGNGVWEPDYDGTADDGLYAYSSTERTEFDTKNGMTAMVGFLTFGASWDSYWLYVPAACDPQSFVFSVQAQPDESAWTADSSCRFALGSDVDEMPNLSGSVSLRISPSLRVAFELDDIVKLMTNTTRKYAATSYKEKSGTAVLAVKFQF